MTSMNGFVYVLSKNIGMTNLLWLRPSERVWRPRSASVLSVSQFVPPQRLRPHVLTRLGVDDAVRIRSYGMVVRAGSENFFLSRFQGMETRSFGRSI